MAEPFNIQIMQQGDNHLFYIHYQYQGNQWRYLKTLFEGLHLPIAETSHGFGFSHMKYYQAQNGRTLVDYLLAQHDRNIVTEAIGGDDINSAFFIETYQPEQSRRITGGIAVGPKVNMAMFRVVPNNKGYVYVRIPRLINVAEYDKWIGRVIKAFNLVFDTTTSVRVSITGLGWGSSR